jgi:TonB family protein
VDAANYPFESLVAGEEGTALIEIVIAPDGAVSEAVMRQSTGHAHLDELAHRAVSTVRFPMPVSQRAIAEVAWRLPFLPADDFMRESRVGGAAVSADDAVVYPRPRDDANRVDALEYPRQALDQHAQGRVLLDVLVSAGGAVIDARLAVSSGSDLLDQAASQIARRYFYEPGTVNGAPANMWVVQRVSFDFGDVGDCYAALRLSAFSRHVPRDGAMAPYDRWTLVDAEGMVRDSLLLTSKGWMRLAPELVAEMNAVANYGPAGDARPAACWLYDGADPLMAG